jgi:hypothetical protein
LLSRKQRQKFSDLPDSFWTDVSGQAHSMLQSGGQKGPTKPDTLRTEMTHRESLRQCRIRLVLGDRYGIGSETENVDELHEVRDQSMKR